MSLQVFICCSQEIAEEHDALIQEKSQNEEDIVKLEGKLQELVQMLELETQRHHDDHQSLYGDTTPELRKVRWQKAITVLREMCQSQYIYWGRFISLFTF